MSIASALGISKNGRVSFKLYVLKKAIPTTPELSASRSLAKGNDTPIKECNRCLQQHGIGECVIPFVCGSPFEAIHNGVCDICDSPIKKKGKDKDAGVPCQGDNIIRFFDLHFVHLKCLINVLEQHSTDTEKPYQVLMDELVRENDIPESVIKTLHEWHHNRNNVRSESNTKEDAHAQGTM